MTVTLRVEGEMVRQARFRTYGCPAMMACGELVCLRSKGEPVEALRAATAAEVVRWCGGVPEGKEHCPELAARALREALRAQSA
jgi:nitrogen fixation NifU-like protein